MRITFEQHGFTVSAEEIKIRMHNLTARYRKEKNLIGPSGGSPSKWPYYVEVHRILGSFRIHIVEEVVEESISDTDATEEWLENEHPCSGSEISPTPSSSRSPSSSGRSAATKKKIVNQDILDEVKRINAIIQAEFERVRDTDERLIGLETERNELLREMNEHVKLFNETFINMMSKLS
ncbi:uncharacterized protein LOC135712581 [Ochlerotatus camptorhynchus]|uniref:uncharacterized protein LOC135712581 n=1 Tax=Ochlerotatus camptorhynchus TaxID=644619 RepID=UPI0031D7419E